MSLIPAFIDEICTYLATHSGGYFSYGVGAGNLKIGELIRGETGVWAKQAMSPPPDMYLPNEWHQIDFWSVESDSSRSYDDLQYVYNVFHQPNEQQIGYDTASWHIYFSYAQMQIEDMGRDIQNRKINKLTIMFITRNLIS